MELEAVAKGYLRMDRDGPTATVTVNRPQAANAMNSMMWRDMGALVRSLGEEPGVRVIILRGAGDRAFVAGADIKEFQEIMTSREGARQYLTWVEGAMSAVETVPKPVIALVHGAAMGGGCELAVACDLRYASEDARFGIPAARLGIVITPMDTQRLARLVGPALAREILMAARILDAQEALQAGLVNRVLPKGELEAYVHKLAKEMAQNAPLTIQGAKRFSLIPPGQVDTALSERAFLSQDFQEGVKAYLEKRPPRFQGS